MSTIARGIKMAATDGPLATSIRRKLAESLKPTQLDLVNDSHKHAGHSAMRGVDSAETHFLLTIVSEAFQGKPLIQRHRLVYAALDDEFKQGLHALNIVAKTSAELAQQQS